jgi:hypothetical protein
MEIIHIQKKVHLLNPSERFHIYNLVRKKQQMNDSFTDTNNPIFDIILKMYPT